MKTKTMKLKIIKVDNYEDAVKKCPKGYRMLRDWELLKEARENKKSPLRYNGNYRFFYALKEGKYYTGLLSYWYGDGRLGVVGSSWCGRGGYAFGVYVKKRNKK